MKNISIKAVLIAFFAVSILDVLISILMVVFEISGEKSDTLYLLFHLFVGLGTTSFGGFIAGYIGKQAPYFNAAVLGVIGVVIAASVNMGEGYPLWFVFFGIVLTIPSTLLGAKLSVSSSRL